MPSKSKSKNKTLSVNSLLSPSGLILFALVFGIIGYCVRALTNAAPIRTTSSITLDQNDPYLGGAITFTSAWPKLTNPINKNQPMFVVDCFQDVDGNGTVDTSSQPGKVSPDLVYGETRSANAAYTTSLTGQAGVTLGGGSSLWLQRGGPATCNATLFYYQKGQGQNIEQYIYLANTGNWQAGGAR